ncbi:MAG: hypothetical protein ACYDCN_00555 [Bacteroidia bacterium]
MSCVFDIVRCVFDVVNESNEGEHLHYFIQSGSFGVLDEVFDDL